jgi:hypothetical protein
MVKLLSEPLNVILSPAVIVKPFASGAIPTPFNPTDKALSSNLASTSKATLLITEPISSPLIIKLPVILFGKSLP